MPVLSTPRTRVRTSDRLAEIAQRIGETIAGPAAYDVDLHARFPAEAVEALKSEGVLSSLVPVEQGGMGATLTDLSDTVRVLSRYCAATGCVLGMHMEQLFILLKHGNTPALRRLVDEIVEKQLLMVWPTPTVRWDSAETCPGASPRWSRRATVSASTSRHSPRPTGAMPT